MAMSKRNFDDLMTIRHNPQQDVFEYVEIATLDRDAVDHRPPVEAEAG